VTNPSLQPQAAFKQPQANFLQNTLDLPATGIKQNRTTITVSSANVLQNSQLKFKGGGSATIFYTGGFPPTSTATLPRIAFDPAGALSFYKNAQPLTASQLQSVQNLYAGDLTSRKNYSTNVANLARTFTSLLNSGKLDASAKKTINAALNNLNSAYNTLSDPSQPAPSPRTLYASVASALGSLNNDCNLNSAQKSIVQTGLNILAIGAANYDTNRVPVAGTPGTPAPMPPPGATAQAAAGFPLPSFDTARNTPLAAAQANPAQVFGSSVVSYLQSIGINNVDPQKIDYQVSSANVLQFIKVPLGNGRSQTVYFNTGFPVPSGSAPQVAFSGASGARQYLATAIPPAGNQQILQSYYANPANAARLANYNINLQNLTASLQTLIQAGQLSPTLQQAGQDAVSALQSAQQTLAAGNLPDIFAVYQQVGADLDIISNNQSPLNNQQRAALNTLNGSLLPVGVENYYLTPISLSAGS
jgi:hypothetical protein